jgi:chromosomal replication initiator protein
MPIDLDQIWKATLGELEVTLSQANFRTWFRDTFIMEFINGKIVIAAPNVFNRDWIRDKYQNETLRTLKKFLPDTKEVAYQVASRGSVSPKIVMSQSRANPQKNSFTPGTNLSKQYTFDNFVIGNTNRFAAASAQAVAEKPGELHNPLFIYGGVGLGKTHLAQAVGNAIVRHNSQKRVTYVPSETFINDFVAGIASGKMKEFKKNYREVDVLIVDDIQFIANKEGSQEEFFHTYNTLHQTNRQIIITADRPPKNITALEERLKSRFSSGLMTDIQPPDFETRLAILTSKAKAQKMNFDEEVTAYIAENIRSNVRDLAGAFNKIATHAQLYREKPTIALCDDLLHDQFTAKEHAVSVEKILTAISKYYNISQSDLMGKKRERIFANARQIAMYLLRHEIGLSYTLIGKELGGKDHTTIMHGARKIERDIVKNNDLKKEVGTIREIIHNP